MSRIAIICPGRGAYTKESLGSLPREHEWVLQADRVRAEQGLESLLDLDGAERFEPSRHLRAVNASALIYTASMLDAATAAAEHDVACVAGNSLGWYTALAVAGALSFEDGFRLVQAMALLQEELEGGGQVIYPVVDADWRPAPERREAIGRLLVENGEIHPSIRLGGYRVLAGTSAGVARLLEELPKVELGKQTFPFRLAQHGPYHTPLVEPVAVRARRELATTPFRAPHTTLVDGRGRRYTPWSTSVDGLRDYTLGEQVTTPFDFTASVKVALCEHGPDRLVLPGPGNSLGGVCGQILALLGWRRIRDRNGFQAVQEGPEPVLESMRR